MLRFWGLKWRANAVEVFRIGEGNDKAGRRARGNVGWGAERMSVVSIVGELM